jgi:hypothetical protein
MLHAREVLAQHARLRFNIDVRRAGSRNAAAVELNCADRTSAYAVAAAAASLAKLLLGQRAIASSGRTARASGLRISARPVRKNRLRSIGLSSDMHDT